MAKDRQTREFGEMKKVVPGLSFSGVFLVLLCSCCCIAAVDPQVPAFIVFGDSTADVGMNSYWPTPVRSNFAPYGENFDGGRPTGRFTNGHMINDMLGKVFRSALSLILIILANFSELKYAQNQHYFLPRLGFCLLLLSFSLFYVNIRCS